MEILKVRNIKTPVKKKKKKIQTEKLRGNILEYANTGHHFSVFGL